MPNALDLVKHGFVKKLKAKKLIEEFEKAKKENFENTDVEKAREWADEDIFEESNEQQINTGFPKPLKRFRLVYESFNLSVEEMYFWFLGHYKQDMKFPEIEKIADVFTQSEGSAQWGNIQQRIGIQQDRVSQYLASIGKMMKESIFPLVRELRIIRERLDIYERWEESHSADVTLKGLFIDLVEGGTKNPTSVYGLSQQVGFTILPDLFFNTHITSLDDVDKEVDKMEFNKQVKNILKRKLTQFVTWANNTHKEHKERYKYTLSVLRQDWNVIKTYISWVKPYLRNVKRLSMREDHAKSPELISGFEGSLAELEFLAKRKMGSHYAVILANFEYRTMPSLSYHAESYQRGPIHVGRVDLRLRAYAWTKEQIENYKKMREEEDTELLGYIDDSLKNAMDALGADLDKFLEEAGEKAGLNKKKKSEEEKKLKAKKFKWGEGATEPFAALFSGINELFIPNISIRRKKKKTRQNPKAAIKEAKFALWQSYKNYKKSHGLIAW